MRDVIIWALGFAAGWVFGLRPENIGKPFWRSFVDGFGWGPLWRWLARRRAPRRALAGCAREPHDGVAPSAPGSSLQPAVSAAIPNADYRLGGDLGLRGIGRNFNDKKD